MLNFNNATDSLVVPTVTKKNNCESYKLRFVNNLSQQEYTLDDLHDLSLNDIYYSFTNLNSKIINNNFLTGEYLYYLTDNNDTSLEMGLARFGDYINTNIQYNNNEKTKIIYNG